MDDGELSHGPIRWPRPGEEHPSAVMQLTNSIRAAYGRELTVRRIVRATGHLFVEGLERSGAYMDEHLISIGSGLGKSLAAGRSTGCVQHGGFHGWRPFTSVDSLSLCLHLSQAPWCRSAFLRRTVCPDKCRSSSTHLPALRQQILDALKVTSRFFAALGVTVLCLFQMPVKACRGDIG